MDAEKAKEVKKELEPSKEESSSSSSSKSKKDEEEKEILYMFRKVEVNIYLLDAIKQVPRYAKFLKELCTSKRKLKGNEKVSMGEEYANCFTKEASPKGKDPGMFSIPCKIANTKFERAMLDIGASINVKPRSIYASLNSRPLQNTSAIIQLVDKSNAYLDGVIEEVVVQINELVFPIDFYVLDMEDDHSSNSSLILLGIPLRTFKNKIDVYDVSLTMEFDYEICRFSIFDAMRYHNDVLFICYLDVINECVNEMFELSDEDPLKVALCHDLEKESIANSERKLAIGEGVEEILKFFDVG
ncbi:uncharacterized protein LOC131172987 [Hevea brasiliensis]|uniref:uncharacterized protein LOC131172987 n=1 Tax=Hevea brasiliensis TaxID=3981 RepID=UPI0025E89D8F|nr:uncharacterized protein LOC131172987 [Hevea brasiliensis]